MNPSYLCTCPQCNHSGALLSSIRKSETWLYSKNGHYGRILQTERAHMFKEPQKKTPVILLLMGSITMLIILMKFLFFITQGLVSSEALSNTHEPAGQFVLNLYTLEDFLPLAVFFILAIGILLYFFSDKKEEQHNDAVYQKDLNRYRTLHYCERCDIIYDQEKRYHPATANGFENAMKYY